VYTLVNDCYHPLRLLAFLTTPSRVSRSGVTGTWSTNLDYPNKATSSAYTQVAIVDVSEHEDDEEELEEEPGLRLVGSLSRIWSSVLAWSFMWARA
jgi:hypothetical protein